VHLKRDQAIIFWAIFLWAMGMGLYNYLWPVYTRQLGAGDVELGFLYSLSFLITTLATIPGGSLADRFDRKWVIIGFWWIAVPSPVIYALAGDWRALIPGILLFNVSNALNPALQAYLSETTEPRRIATTFNVVFAAFPLGMVISPAVGGWLARGFGLRSVFWVTFAFYLVSSLSLFLLTPQPPRRVVRRDKPARAPASPGGGWLAAPEVRPLLRLSLFFGLVMGLWNLYLPFSTPFLEDVAGLDVSWVGVLGTLASLGAAILSPLLGRLADRNGLPRVLGWSLAAQLAPLGLWLLWPTALPALAGSMFLRGLQDGSRGVMTSMVGHHMTGPKAGDRRQLAGRGFALYAVVTGLFQAVTPYVGGWLYRYGAPVPFLAALVGLALATLSLPSVVARWGDGRV